MTKMDLTGQRFGMLLVTEFSEQRGSQRYWKCRCDCGNESTASLGNLRSGHTRSCGCQRSTTTTALKTKHSMYGTPTYRSWSMMLTRCNNKKNHKYADYGARGISVCPEWHLFEAFFADMGARPEGTTLGRCENDGNYEKGNCQWETALQQGRNKRNTRLFEVDGVSATLGEHCEKHGADYVTTKRRIYSQGFTAQEAFSNYPATA